jgi:response regulator RpfG family c-di-GMP phosphodiesterase
MIASNAIKVYASVGQPDGEYVTTVFTPHDAIQARTKLFKRTGVRRVIFKTVNEKELASYNNDRVQKL